MKNINLLALGGATVLLSACGTSTDLAEEANICDAYLAYTQCTLEESGMDADSVKTVLEQTKSAWAQLPEDQMDAACTQAIDAIKMAGATASKCELPNTTEEEAEEATEEVAADMEKAVEDVADDLEEVEEATEEVAADMEKAVEDVADDLEEATNAADEATTQKSE